MTFCFMFVGSKHHQPFPLQVREPAEVISNDVVVLTSLTCHYHNTFVVRQLGNLLHGPGGANLQIKLELIHMKQDN